MTTTLPPTTVDAFLGGRVEAVQPASGHHRSGLEAVLLATALAPAATGIAVDLGAGAGVAGLCAASRCPGLAVTLVERDFELVACAEAALLRPANYAFASRIGVARLDIEAANEEQRGAAGIAREAAAIVLTNPPFYAAGTVRASPSDGRAAAHVLSGGLESWFRFAAWTLAPGGVLVAVLAADALAEALAAAAGRFGEATILPIHPRAAAKALRVLVAARKGSRGGLALLPGLVLHAGEGRFAPGVEALLRGEADLAGIHPAWRAVT